MAQDWLGTPYDLAGKRIWVAGHNGLVGRATVKALQERGVTVLSASREGLDLTSQAQVRDWMSAHKPDAVIMAAGRVGGIGANAAYPAAFLYENLMMAANVIHSAYECGVERLLYLGSSCIYPKDAALPLSPDALLSGALEPTNEGYALAKICGVRLCRFYRAQYGCDFMSAMPCNLYGPGDRFDQEDSHVIPALMMKAHAAKMAGAPALQVWGSGKPLREFLYVEDLAAGLVFALERYTGAAPLNIGSGEEITIADLARMIAHVTGYQGELVFDTDKPDGVLRKVMDSSVIRQAGWSPRFSLEEGLRQTYAWYVDHYCRDAA